MLGFNMDLQSQITQLTKILSMNKTLYSVIEKAASIGMKNYYIGAGCIAQTVWNYQMGLELTNGITDIDFSYYDNTDLSHEAENSAIERLKSIINSNVIELDIKNQARVHLWYKEHFGYDISPYDSIENAINSWPTTATSIGVRLDKEFIRVYAPFGLNDLFGMIVKANKVQITEEIYMQKAKKWHTKWPALTIVPW
ncbi:MAG: nucleotidyltransferase family protein [Clostridiales bacterium]|nr:nucleotidyltransferase family protein [Clostridiales bacterium]